MQTAAICLAHADPEPRVPLPGSYFPKSLSICSGRQAVGELGDAAGASPEGPCMDKHWAGSAAPYRWVTAQLKQTRPSQEKQRSTRGDAQLWSLREPVPSCCMPGPYPVPANLSKPSLRGDLQVTGAAPQPKSVPMFRTCFHSHLGEEYPCSIDRGGSWHQCHRGGWQPQGYRSAGQGDRIRSGPRAGWPRPPTFPAFPWDTRLPFPQYAPPEPQDGWFASP